MSMFRDAEEDANGDSHILSGLPSETEITASSGQTRSHDQCSTWGDAPQTDGGPGSCGAEGTRHIDHHGHDSNSGQKSEYTVRITINNAFLLGTIFLCCRDNSSRRPGSGGHIVSLYDAGAGSSHVLVNPEENPTDCAESGEFAAKDMEIPDTVWSRYCGQKARWIPTGFR